MLGKICEKTRKILLDNYKFIISLIVLIIFCTYEFSYVVYKPGGVVNLSDRIDVKSGYEYEGELSMSYVSLMKGTLPVLVLSYIMPNWDIVPKEDITLKDQSIDELLELEKLYMKSSIDNATIVAYKNADKEINNLKTINNIILISEEAKTDLRLYDKIMSVAGKEIETIDDIKNIISEYKAGDEISIKVERKGKILNKKAKIYEIKDGLKIGIATLETYEYQTNPELEIKTKSSESGSSGGLMLSLAIYNELVEEDITKGKNIVGTGTIDINGNVGEIDGVKYKILGAARNDADIFICPIENYEEAIKVKEEGELDIEIKSVSTFAEALEYLNSL